MCSIGWLQTAGSGMGPWMWWGMAVMVLGLAFIAGAMRSWFGPSRGVHHH